MSHPDVVIQRIASRQHGTVSFAQMVRAGVTDDEIRRRSESGHLLRLHRGVYAVGHVALPPLARYAAALLAVRNGVISHRSAAEIHRLLPLTAGPVHVSVTDGQARHRRGIRIHRPGELGEEEVRRRDGLRVTSPARTIVDLEPSASDDELERMVSEAFALRPVSDLPRVGRLEGLLADGPRVTRSALERRFLKLVRDAGLPAPETNQRIGRHQVDALWREQGLAVELDSWQFHGHRLAFERDSRKTQALDLAGLRVWRVTSRQIDRPFELVARLAAALA